MSTTVLGPTIPAQLGINGGVSGGVIDTVDQERLPCRREDPELFFAESPSDVELAKALCLECPVMTECLAGALERREPWGVWGGQLFLQGVVIPRKRPRGRPRKTEVAA
jgi:WhiB family transcriptional regulator, redox-sensing transcriptional regulator